MPNHCHLKTRCFCKVDLPIILLWSQALNYALMLYLSTPHIITLLFYHEKKNDHELLIIVPLSINIFNLPWWHQNIDEINLQGWAADHYRHAHCWSPQTSEDGTRPACAIIPLYGPWSLKYWNTNTSLEAADFAQLTTVINCR